jgi:hypothetical protein
MERSDLSCAKGVHPKNTLVTFSRGGRSICHGTGPGDDSFNHLEFWKRLVELENDPLLPSSNRRPSSRFDKVLFSGT